ncbi:MAG: trypsin-like peptidase domain-containing protein [Clostridia bacterium]|nr:trypsin-like peptidase domain-containing protein [Clostridia bacterium]
MDEKKTDPSGYEPNFVMKDAAEPEPAENQPNMAENQPDMPEDPAKAAAPPGDQEDFAQKAASGASNDFEKKGAFRDPREAFRNTEPGTSSYQYNEHNRPGSVKDNFGGSPYTGYVDENGNMHYSNYGRQHQNPGQNDHAGQSGQRYYGQQSGGYGFAEQQPGGRGFAGQQPGDEACTSSWSSSDGVTRTHRAKGVKKPKKPRQPGRPVSLTRKSLALLIALCVVVSALFGFGGSYLANALNGGHSGSSKTASVSKNGYKLEDATGSKMTVQEVTNKTKDSVVEIKTESVSADAWMQQYVTEGAGSGVVMTADGYIMTNNHVIDGASKITVTTSDDKEYEAKLVGTDSITDIAVLKISAKNLTPATYGNSDQLAVGDMAVAIGNPLGELGGTVSAGIISALDRELAIDGKTMTLLQTDASINPGNSGGGLFNGDGQLIGIVVAKSSGSNVEGLGFAIPINKAADVAQQLMDKGYVSDQPSTGMSYAESSQGNGAAQFFGNSQDSQSQSSSAAVYIQEVTGTNAKKAGFQSGDLVYAVDGTRITSFNTLSSIVTSHKVGDKLTYTIVRGNQTKEIKLTLEEKKASN